MYTTAQSLVDHFGAREISEVSGPQDADVVSAEHLREILKETPDTSEWGTAAIAAAEAAKTRIEEAIATADSTIDMAIRSVGSETPIAGIPPALIVAISEDLARYDLHKERPTKAITERYKASMGTLDKIAKGTLVIGLPLKSDGASGITVDASDQVFTDDVLSGYA